MCAWHWIARLGSVLTKTRHARTHCYTDVGCAHMPKAAMHQGGLDMHKTKAYITFAYSTGRFANAVPLAMHVLLNRSLHMQTVVSFLELQHVLHNWLNAVASTMVPCRQQAVQRCCPNPPWQLICALVNRAGVLSSWLLPARTAPDESKT